MKFLILILLFCTMSQNRTTIYNFEKDKGTSQWFVVDDVVMGGRSSGNLFINKDGHGVFSGEISLENNGGFSSIRLRIPPMETQSTSKVLLKIKGDGKSYQFRVKSNVRDYYSYVISFATSGSWETIEIPLNSMYPSFRGRTLNRPNFSASQIEEIAFLIANKVPESFQLEIDSIILED